MRSLRLLLFVSLVVAASPAGVPIQTHHTVRHAGTSTPGNGLSDRQLENAIRARFAGSKISVNKFQVHVQGGIATVEGHTDVIQHKGTATRLAKAAGARDVVNRVEISEAAKERAAANLAKGRRRVQIKRGDARSERRSK
jgi:hypothetical protein